MYLKKLFTKILLFLFILFFISNFYSAYADDLEYNNDFVYINDISTQETSSNITENSLNLNSRSCVVLDRVSKQILFGKNENNKVKMASTTKIMTAIVIIENCNLDESIEVSKKAAGTGGSRLGLKTGDKITINNLLYGLMLCSGNDAAVALAESCAENITEFSNLMNKKAEELGLLNTHFESPHGLDSDEHYTTAYELSLLSDYALKNETFLKIVRTQNYTITINGYPKTLSNTNELLGNLDGVYGIKTGFTNGANRCLVTACKRGNMDIICVVLGADTKKFRTQDSIKLIEYAFKNFEYINIDDIANQKLEDWKKIYLSDFSVNKATSNYIELGINKLENPIVSIKKELINNIESSIYIDQNLYAPLYKGQVIGSINLYANDNQISNINIITNNTILKKSIFDYFYILLKNNSQIYKNFINNFYNYPPV